MDRNERLRRAKLALANLRSYLAEEADAAIIAADKPYANNEDGYGHLQEIGRGMAEYGAMLLDAVEGREPRDKAAITKKVRIAVGYRS